jgi:UDP-glucose 4-epimerase
MERAMNKKILVTGAAGFLGRYLVEGLLGEGYEVYALIHRKPMPDHLKGLRLHVVSGDFDDQKLLSHVLPEVDTVCHAAAFIPPGYNDPAYAEECLTTNGLKTLGLAQAVSKKPGCRFVYFSAGTFYRYSEIPVNEESPVYPPQKAFYYSMGKLVGEFYVEQFRMAHKLHALILRIGSCYGWGMPEKSVIAQFMRSAAQGSPLKLTEGGLSTYDFIQVLDVVRAVKDGLHTDSQGIYNVGSGRATSVLELSRAVAQVYPERNVQVDVQPPAGEVNRGFPSMSTEKARKAWGFKAMSLQEGLRIYRQDLDRQSLIKTN